MLLRWCTKGLSCCLLEASNIKGTKSKTHFLRPFCQTEKRGGHFVQRTRHAWGHVLEAAEMMQKISQFMGEGGLCHAWKGLAFPTQSPYTKLRDNWLCLGMNVWLSKVQLLWINNIKHPIGRTSCQVFYLASGKKTSSLCTIEMSERVGYGDAYNYSTLKVKAGGLLQSWGQLELQGKLQGSLDYHVTKTNNQTDKENQKTILTRVTQQPLKCQLTPN